MSKRGLGKGLGALIPDLEINSGDTVSLIPINEIRPNPHQPRKTFDDEKIAELAASIKEHGVVQPILLRSTADGYELIAGERRWRAAKIAGLKSIPAITKEFSDAQMMEIALIENIQRENLNPIEEALAYKKLMDTFALTQSQLAEKVGKSRPAVANVLRLLNLPSEIQSGVSRGTISFGHAKALLAVDDPIKLQKIYLKIVENNYSVRQTEELIKEMNSKSVNVSRRTNKNTPKANNASVHLKSIENNLAEKLGTKVKIVTGTNKGKIEIEYYSTEDLERILEIISN